MNPILLGIILFIIIAWALQAWDVYRTKIINPIGNYFENHGQLIWIVFLFWGLLFFRKQINIFPFEYLKPVENFVENSVDPDTIQEIGIDPLCGCPTAFPRDQRFSDGKTFTMGVKGSYFYPLPLKCGLPVGTCSKPIPTSFPPKFRQWIMKTGGLTPAPPEEPPGPPSPPLPPTYRDKYGVGPRSFWCVENNKCVRKLEDPLRPWKNTCGNTTVISQIPPPVYHSEAECKKGYKPCDGLGFNKCIETDRCGWCQDRSGVGKCVSGTPEGPDDLTLNCTANLLQPSGAWIPGYANPYILEEGNQEGTAAQEWDFNPETQPLMPAIRTNLLQNEGGWEKIRNQMIPPGMVNFLNKS